MSNRVIASRRAAKVGLGVVLASAGSASAGAQPAGEPHGERPPPARSSAAAPLWRSLDRRMRQAGAASGAYVFDATANRILYLSRPGARRILASNTKLFTTAAALDRFGPTARLQTSVWRVGELAPIREPVRRKPAPKKDPAPAPEEEPPPEIEVDEGLGTAAASRRYELKGSLYLRGGGDPAFGSRRFASRYLHGMVTRAIDLAERVERTGIRKVTGRLYADDTLFDRLRGVPYSGWALTRHIGPVSALSYNSGYAGDLAGHFALDPARFAAEQLKAALRRRGVKIAGGVALGRLPAAAAGRRRIAAVNSPRIAELIRTTNVDSNNFFAEMLLKGLGARYGRAGTTRAGARVVRGFARQAGSRITAVDGSGLSYANTASPRAVSRLLLTMLDHPSYASFLGSLPIAGRQGTLSDRMRGTAAQDRCRAKTGTVNYVSTLSGYCRTRSDHQILFSFLMNRVSVSAARRIQDSMTALLARR